MIFKSLIIAFSMYSKIPVPKIEWSEKNLRYVLCFFPLVGAVIGLFEFLWMKFCYVFEAGKILQTLILFVIPLLISGGIHADGFIDTSDALSSYKGKEDKLFILKDSHIGAFALIKFILISSVYVAFSSCFVFEKKFFVWTLSFMLSRVLSGFAAANFKCAKNNGTLYTFSSLAVKKITNALLVIEFIFCLILILKIDLISAICILVSMTVFFAYFRIMSYKEFGGITGDLCGWLVCMLETLSTVACGILFLIGI